MLARNSLLERLAFSASSFEIVGMSEGLEIHAEELGFGIAENIANHMVDEEPMAIQVDQGDTNRGVIKHTSKSIFLKK